MSDVRVALDGNGFAAVSNEETRNRANSFQFSVRASRYSFSDNAFRDGITLAAGDSAANSFKVLANDQSGQVIEFVQEATLHVGLPSVNVLKSCLFVLNQGWGCSVSSFVPYALSMDGAGQALASRVAGSSLVANHFNPGTGWGVDQILSTDDPKFGIVALVYWSGGIGYAVWVDRQDNIRASRFVRSTDTWEPSQVLGVGSRAHVALARNAASAAALVVWVDLTGGFQYSQYIPGNGWQGAQPIPLLSTNEMNPSQLAMASNGDAMLIGVVGQGAQASNLIRAIRFKNGGWETLQTIGSVGSTVPQNTQIVMDGVGNAIALYVNVNTGELIANRFSVVSGWQGAETIGILTGIASANGDFDIDMDETGRAMAVWPGDAGPAFPLGSSRLRTYTAGGFTVALTPSILPLQRNGDSQRATVSITRLGYTGPIDLQHFDCPAKVICVFDQSQIPGNENNTGLTFLTNLNDPALAGNYVVRVTGTGGGATTEAFIEVQIQ
ncbi:MAG: hypothetical protein E8D47_12685 [Nitrospira sp.]|nr:MAG: hypothetical protein E8D47_12685 [Nitrospira sp.]